MGLNLCSQSLQNILPKIPELQFSETAEVTNAANLKKSKK